MGLVWTSAPSLKTWIPVTECKRGFLYHIAARNFFLGVYAERPESTNAEGRTIPRSYSFFGVRHKFGRSYVDDELHWDTDDRFGTAKPITLLEECPILITAALEYDHDALLQWLEGRGRIYSDVP